MSEISVLQDVDPEVLQALCRDSTDDVAKALSTTNAASAIGLLKQVMQVSQQCKNVLDGVKNRMYDINKRIGIAQKSVGDYHKRITDKKETLKSTDIDTLYEESLRHEVVSRTPFDFFSLPKKRDYSERPQRPIPRFEVFSTVTDVEPFVLRDEFISLSSGQSKEIRRVQTTESSEPTFPSVPSLLASFAQSSIVLPSVRLSDTCDLNDDLNLSLIPSWPDELPSDHSIPLGSIPGVSAPSSVPESKASAHKEVIQPNPRRDIAPKKKEPPPIPQSEVPVNKKAPPPIPKSEIPSKKATPPPLPPGRAPTQPSSQTSRPPSDSSGTYKPPTDFLSEIRQKGSERMARSAVQSQPPPEPPRPTQPSQSTRSSHSVHSVQSVQSVQSTQSTQSTQSAQSTRSAHSAHSSQSSLPSQSSKPPRPLPSSFLEEIRQKGSERMAKAPAHTEPPPEPSKPLLSTQSTRSTQSSQSASSGQPNPPPRPLPSNFLEEIRQKGSERMAKAPTHTEASSEPSKLSSSSQSARSTQSSQSTPSNQSSKPPRPLPSSFLEEIRQKGSERMAKAPTHTEPPPEPSKPLQSTQSTRSTQSSQASQSSQSNPPPRPLPSNFLEEIRQKGAERMARGPAHVDDSQNTSSSSDMKVKLRQKSGLNTSFGSLNSKASTVRRSGTLSGIGSGKRYGTSILNQVRSGHSTLKICSEGEEPQQPKSGGNPLLDEIKNFDFSRLRKVNDEKTDKVSTKDNSKEPTLAEMMRSRLECFKDDSSVDSDDSRFDFSD